MALGDNIKRMREEHSLTQQQLTAVTPKPTGIFAVEDPGLAKLVTDRLARQGTPQRADDEESN